MKLKKLFVILITALCCLLLCSSALAASLSAAADALPADGSNATKIYITIVNNNNNDDDATNDDLPLDNITISNQYNILFDTAGVSIAPGSSHTFTSGQIALTAQLINTPLSFDAKWFENGVEKSGKATVTVSFDGAAAAAEVISVTRTLSNTKASPGDVVTVTYTVTNTGFTPLKKISLSDKELAGSTPIFKDIALAPGELHQFVYEYKMGSATVISKPVVTYTVEGEKDPRTFDGVTEATLGMVNAKLSVDVVQGEASESGVTFSVTLTNNGNQRIKNIKVKDDQDAELNDEAFALAIGETKTLTHTVKTDAERFVVFYITGTTGSDESYEDKTKSFTVRKYIDPSLLGISFNAEVIEPLNAEGSITVRFTIGNTGSMDMTNLVISEGEQGELKRIDTVPPGEHVIDQTVYVGSPHDLVFRLDMTDVAGNPYNYTANITADYVGVEVAPAEPAEEPGVETLGAEIGSSVIDGLKVTFIILAVLTGLCGVALIVIAVLESKKRAEIARKKAQRERYEREQQHRQQNQSTLRGNDTSGSARPSSPSAGDTGRYPRNGDATSRYTRPTSPSSARPAPGAKSDMGATSRYPRQTDGDRNTTSRYTRQTDGNMGVTRKSTRPSEYSGSSRQGSAPRSGDTYSGSTRTAPRRSLNTDDLDLSSTRRSPRPTSRPTGTPGSGKPVKYDDRPDPKL